MVPVITPPTCCICGSIDLKLVKKSNLPHLLSNHDFTITNKQYGISGAVDKCLHCGFLQCSDLFDVIGHYETLEDPGYEESRATRALQKRKILYKIQRFKKEGRLLDIGAGSGILVEQALKVGFFAMGIEPSQWFQAIAHKRGTPVVRGVFPNENLKGPFDIVTLIDVIEHVNNPVMLLKNIAESLSENGIGVIVTPNISSFVARLMGWKWWHIRAAHIGYFNNKTLKLALDKAGLQIFFTAHPSWYFTADYLLERFFSYFTLLSKLKLPVFLKRITVPVNFGDTLMVFFRKKQIN